MNYQYFSEMLFLNTLLFFLPSVMFARELRKYITFGKESPMWIRIVRLMTMGLWLRVALTQLIFNHLYYFVESGIF